MTKLGKLAPSVAVLIICGCSIQLVGAQTPSDIPSGATSVRPPLPLTDGDPEDAPAPEWDVWRVFYDSLDAHRAYLEALIGPDKLAWLNGYLTRTVAPSVRVATKGKRLPPDQRP